MYPKILKNFIYPSIQIKYPQRKQLITYLQLLEKTQWWSPSELKRFQQKKLQILLRHAYENVPYYHRMFDKLGLKPQDIKITTDLQQLPILTKEIIRNNLDKLTAKNYSKGELVATYTGGSTGKPMRFFRDKRHGAWNMAAAYREWGWAGYNLGDRIAYLWAAHEDLSRQAKLKSKIFNMIQRRIFLDSYEISEKSLDEYVRILRKFKPKIINGIVSALYLMAHYMEKRGINDIRPKAILSSCEMLLNYQREIIEEAFGCEVFDYYTGRDTCLHASECPEHTGYHITVENGVIEFIKDNENVAPGELGKIIITDLCNFGMPFIRYEIGDLGIPSDETCSCGRGLPLMKSIEGRTTDMLMRTDGSYIAGSILTLLCKNFENIRQFQIIQKTKNNVILKLVKGEEYTDKDSKLLKEEMKKYLGNELNIQISFVDSIPPTRSGKYRFIISEVEIDI